MARPARPWIVTPHDPLQKHETNLWTVAGEVPKVRGLNRRMAIIRLSDGRLVFYNAIPLDERALAEVKAWGQPSILIVPEHSHAVDARAFRERLALKAYCPAPERTQVEERVPVDGTLDQLSLGPTVRLEPVEGSKNGEPVLFVVSGERVSLIVCDVLMNLPHRGLVMRLAGFSGATKVVPLWRLRAMADKAKVRAHLQRIATTPGLSRLVFSHGDLVEDGASAAVASAAARL